jgi:prepilin-type N-terminal cleavage/methylation domain-containing protein
MLAYRPGAGKGVRSQGDRQAGPNIGWEPQMKRTRARQQGMTLLEVLIAMMLLGVVALIIFTAFGIGLRAAALAAGMNTATGLAEETLATLTAAPCGSSFRTTLP